MIDQRGVFSGGESQTWRAEEERLDAYQVMTTRGLINSVDLGFTLTHEHLILNTSPVTGNRDGYLYDRDQALREIEPFMAASGATIVEVTNGGMGRSPETLRWLSEKSGLNIVMGCGWYREPYYDRRLWRQTTADITAGLVHEIEHGYADTGIRPGVIGEIGADKDFVSPVEERVLRAVARAHRRTGLAIVTHAVDSSVGLAQLDLLEEEGADLRRIAIAHCATWPDPDYHEAIACRGAYAQFDIAGRYPHETRYQLRQVMEFIRRGHLEHLLISHDIYARSHLVAYGGQGYAYLPSEFTKVLSDEGLNQEEIDTIFVRNPRRWLTGNQLI